LKSFMARKKAGLPVRGPGGMAEALKKAAELLD
jgi:hypothetical protein